MAESLSPEQEAPTSSVGRRLGEESRRNLFVRRPAGFGLHAAKVWGRLSPQTSSHEVLRTRKKVRALSERLNNSETRMLKSVSRLAVDSPSGSLAHSLRDEVRRTRAL